MGRKARRRKTIKEAVRLARGGAHPPGAGIATRRARRAVPKKVMNVGKGFLEAMRRKASE